MVTTRSQTKSDSSNKGRNRRNEPASQQSRPGMSQLNENEEEDIEESNDGQESIYPVNDLRDMENEENYENEFLNKDTHHKAKKRVTAKPTKSKSFTDNNDKSNAQVKTLEEKGDKKSNCCSYLFTIILMLASVGGIYYYYYLLIQPSIDPKLIREFVDKLDSQIPAIGKKTLHSALSKALRSGLMKGPVFLLLIGSTKQKTVLNGLARQIGQFAMGLQNSQPAPVVSLDNSYQMKDIEQVYIKTFKTEKKPVLVLENLEQIPPGIAMVFHQFANNEDSRVASAFSVATLTHSHANFVVKSSITMRDTSTFSSKCLNELWKTSLSQDDLECLVNRLTEHPVLLISQ